ncbi:GrdX family protein [Treponema denticola]|uniref:GrdX protein n=1 Tax=Treponema denticola TaxID=158 RepID=A0A9Q9BM93_TREDN|nr:GrdX family protein [Treponema denticola]UTC90304.1 GrdX protein [Treponema denticola]UTD00344.1 GrdX protein [Treponema denticola]UTD05171.1 GrdX family protein [Treponema denticola]
MQKDSQTNKRLIITNNPKVRTFYEEDRTGLKNRYELTFLDSRDEVFKTVRDLIHSNWKLLNHAMAGNIPLHKHPYRSMALEQQENLDTNSLILWESAMERVKRGKTPPYPDDVLEDFQELDYNLFSGSVKF